MNEVIIRKNGKPVEIPEVNLDLKMVEHRGMKLAMFMERSPVAAPRFARLIVPDDPPDGYSEASRDYMEEVLGFSCTLSMELFLAAAQRRNDKLAEKEGKSLEPMKSEHINADGEFKSDKYPWCRPGFVPLKLTDRTAQPHLWRYAIIRGAVDKAFTDDLCACLRTSGYVGVPPFVGPTRKKGPPASQFESDKGFGDVERDEHGARIIYWQKFPAYEVNVRFLDRKGDTVDPDAGDDIWSHCWLASVPGFNHIHEHAVAYIELYSDRAQAAVRLDYSDPCHSFRLPGGKKLSDFDKIEVGYCNMELRGSPPPWPPGALQPK